MQLDERTLFFVIGLLTGLLALVAWGVRVGLGERASGVGLWAVALATITIPSLLLLVFASAVVPLMQNAFWVPSMVLTGYAVSVFFGRAGSGWAWIAAGLALYAVSALLSVRPTDASLRIVTLSAGHVAFVAVALRALWLGAPSRRDLGAVLMAVGLLLLIGASTYRGTSAALDGAGAVMFNAGALVVPLFQSMLIVALVAVTLGFMLLAADRLRRGMEQLATHDPLTGLLNRRGFADRSTPLLAAARRRSESVAMALLDLDDFKQVNDRHGHEVGDRLLVDVGLVLGDNAREQDVVARLGGEEFAVLMPDTGLDGAVRVAERLRAALEERLCIGGGAHRVTASVGLAVRIAPTSVQSLYGAADRSLYAAKSAGKNRVAEPAS
jgi:diguanylate cyclase (GGDEF)-like protein